MSDPGNAFAVEEYRSLRATIRERGTTRLFVTALTFVGWAALVLLGWSVTANFPPAALPALLVLAAGFEVVFATHTAAERVGRYLFVRFEQEEGSGSGWERAVLAFSGPSAVTIDALNVRLFAFAALVNLAPVVARLASAQAGLNFFAPYLMLAAGVAAAHVAFGLRLLRARRFARGQRAADTAVLQSKR
jgi:hypothetical protein